MGKENKISKVQKLGMKTQHLPTLTIANLLVIHMIGINVIIRFIGSLHMQTSITEASTELIMNIPDILIKPLGEQL